MTAKQKDRSCISILRLLHTEYGNITQLYANSIPFTYTYYYFQLRTAAFKAYCAIWVRRSNFRHQASPSVSPRKSTQRRKVEL